MIEGKRSAAWECDLDPRIGRPLCLARMYAPLYDSAVTARTRWLLVGIGGVTVITLAVLFWANVDRPPQGVALQESEAGRTWVLDSGGYLNSRTVILQATFVRSGDLFECQGSGPGIVAPAPGTSTRVYGLTLKTAGDGSVTVTCADKGDFAST
jgi:hypothetical protein